MKDPALLERLHELETDLDQIRNQLEPPKKSVFQYVRRFARFVSAHWAVIFSLLLAAFIYWKYGIGYFEPQKNLSLTKKASDSYVKLADQLMLNGQFDAAKESYSAALKANPSNVDATRGLLKTDVLEPVPGQKYITPEVEKTKIDHLRTVLERDEDTGIVAHLTRLFNRAPARDNETYIISYFRGLQYEQRENYGCAKIFYQEAINRNSEFVGGYIALAYVHVLAGDPAECAIGVLGKFENNNRSAVALNNLGYCYLIKGDFEKADKLFDKSLLISQYLETYVNLGDGYRYLRDADSALWHHNAALKWVEDSQNEKENAVAGTLAINFMPTKLGDTETPKTYVEIRDINQKRMLVLYELSLDYALKEDFVRADQTFNAAFALDPEGAYQAFIDNKIESIENLSQNLSESPIPKRSLRWFEKQRRRFKLLPTPQENIGPQSKPPTTCIDLSIKCE